MQNLYYQLPNHYSSLPLCHGTNRHRQNTARTPPEHRLNTGSITEIVQPVFNLLHAGLLVQVLAEF